MSWADTHHYETGCRACRMTDPSRVWLPTSITIVHWQTHSHWDRGKHWNGALHSRMAALWDDLGVWKSALSNWRLSVLWCTGNMQTSKLHRDIGYVPPTDTGSLCLAVDSTHTVVGLFRLLVRRSGTHCQMNSRDPACDVDSFKQFFKTILFSSY